MDHLEAGRLWDENAETWTRLSRLGYDVFRDLVNSPAFFRLLPDVSGKRGLDLGCGEGTNTRALAGRGARLAAVDLSAVFLRHASASEAAEPREIAFARASGLALPFVERSFDFATAFMSVMDMPEHPRVFRELHRVLVPGGFFQFSISHPCFMTPRFRWILGEDGQRVGVECGDYFKKLEGEIEEWTFNSAPPEVKAGVKKFKVPRFTRTLSSWLNLLLETGFVLERFEEPQPDAEAIRRYPKIAHVGIVPYSLIVRARRPA